MISFYLHRAVCPGNHLFNVKVTKHQELFQTMFIKFKVLAGAGGIYFGSFPSPWNSIMSCLVNYAACKDKDNEPYYFQGL